MPDVKKKMLLYWILYGCLLVYSYGNYTSNSVSRECMDDEVWYGDIRLVGCMKYETITFYDTKENIILKQLSIPEPGFGQKIILDNDIMLVKSFQKVFVFSNVFDDEACVLEWPFEDMIVPDSLITFDNPHLAITDAFGQTHTMHMFYKSCSIIFSQVVDYERVQKRAVDVQESVIPQELFFLKHQLFIKFEEMLQVYKIGTRQIEQYICQNSSLFFEHVDESIRFSCSNHSILCTVDSCENEYAGVGVGEQAGVIVHQTLLLKLSNTLSSRRNLSFLDVALSNSLPWYGYVGVGSLIGIILFLCIVYIKKRSKKNVKYVPVFQNVV